MNRKIIIIGFVIAFSIVFLIGYTNEINAESKPPDDGDWIIENETLVKNKEILLNGNLIINNGSKLTFDNVTLKMNCTTNGEYKIKIKKGGEFFARNNTNITSNNTIFLYKFEVHGKMELNNCVISDLWGGERFRIQDNFTGGIEIYSSNVSISNCSIINFFTVGVNCKVSMINIVNNTIGNEKNQQFTYGIICTSTDAKIFNNNISNTYYGIYSTYSNIIIYGNKFSNDISLYCNYGIIEIKDNIFTDNFISIYGIRINVTILNNKLNGVGLFFGDYAYIANNLISQNLGLYYGIMGFNNNLTIENNTILGSNLKNSELPNIGMYISNTQNVKSQAIIRKNHISQTKSAIICYNATILENVILNNEKGIYSVGGSSIIQKNIFENNDEGIYSNSSTLQISENQFTNNKIGIHVINGELDIEEIKDENNFKNSEYIIWQERNLKINVKYSNGTITENATIVIRDINGKKVWNGTTNQYGIGTNTTYNISISLTEYKLSINGDESRFSPYNITVEKDNITNWTEIIIDENTENITIVLTIPEIEIRKTKEESNLWLPILLVGLLFMLVFISSINFYRSSTKHNTIQDFKLPDIYNEKQFNNPLKRKPPPLDKSIQPQKCPYCRSEIPGDLKTCNMCGQRIKI